MTTKSNRFDVTYRLAAGLIAGAAAAALLPGQWTDPNKYAVVALIALAAFDTVSFEKRFILHAVLAASVGLFAGALYLHFLATGRAVSPIWVAGILTMTAYSGVIICRWILKTRAARQP